MFWFWTGIVLLAASQIVGLMVGAPIWVLFATPSPLTQIVYLGVSLEITLFVLGIIALFVGLAPI